LNDSILEYFILERGFTFGVEIPLRDFSLVDIHLNFQKTQVIIFHFALQY